MINKDEIRKMLIAGTLLRLCEYENFMIPECQEIFDRLDLGVITKRKGSECLYMSTSADHAIINSAMC